MGGSARTWTGTLPADLAAGGTIQLRLVMTKFGSPAVQIAYAISVQAAS